MKIDERFIIVALLVAITPLFQIASACGDELSLTYRFSTPEVRELGRYAEVAISGCRSCGRPGHPILPARAAFVLLPAGEEIVHVSVLSRREIAQDVRKRVMPGQLVVSLGARKPPPEVGPVEHVYSSTATYPEFSYQVSSIQRLCGYQIAVIVLYPVSYLPSAGRIIAAGEMELRVITEPSGQVMAETRSMLRKSAEGRVASLVDNPGELKTYRGIVESSGGTLDTDASYPYLVVTSQSLRQSFEPFAAFKTRRGLNATVVTVEEIEAQYGGEDLQEQIRNFVIDAYQNWETSYLLLGGDDEILPHRGLYDVVNEEYPGYMRVDNDIPADLYYAGLDGSWNDDGDERWGEPGEDDLLAEVWVGRAAVDSPDEASNFVAKSMAYQQCPAVDDCVQALMCGEDMGWLVWGGDYKDEIKYGSSAWGYTTAGFPAQFSVASLYDREGTWDPFVHLLPLMNGGLNLINHMGHANVTEAMKFDKADITDDNYTNDGTNHGFYLIYTQGCYCNSFDNRTTMPGVYTSDAISEAFTTIENGAVAFVGNSRYGWGKSSSTDGPSQHYDRQFFDAIFGEGVFEVGAVLQDSKEDNVGFINEDGLRWCYYQLNLLGDPQLDIWTHIPAELTIQHPSLCPVGVTPFVVQVEEDDALVALSRNGTLVGAAYSSAGQAVIDLEPVPNDVCTLTVVITKHDYLPYQGTVDVHPVAMATIYPETLALGAPTPVAVSVTDTAGQPLPQVVISISGWEISSTDTTGPMGNATLVVDPPYGEMLSVHGREVGQGYDLFTDSIVVTGGLDLAHPDISAAVGSLGLSDTLVPHYQGSVIASCDHAGFTLFLRGCGLDTQVVASGSAVELSATPVAAGELRGAVALSGYNVFEERFPVVCVYGTLSGTVRDSVTGLPLAGVSVFGYEAGADTASSDPVFWATTDSVGEYGVDRDLEVGPYQVHALSFGHLPRCGSTMVMYGATVHDIVLSPAPDGVIYGWVREAGTCAPLSATIRIHRADDGSLFTTTAAGGDGEYSVSIPYFSYRLYVTAHRHVPQGRLVPLYEDSLEENFSATATAGYLLVVDDLEPHEPATDQAFDGKEEYSRDCLEERSAVLLARQLMQSDYWAEMAEAPSADLARLSEYDVVVWSAGDNVHPVSRDSYREGLLSYVAGGGRLLVEGGEVGYDAISCPGYPELASGVLHITAWHGDNSGGLRLVSSDHPLARSPHLLPDTLSMAYQGYGDQDASTPAPDAQVIFDCLLDPGDAGIVAYDDTPSSPNSGQIVFYSFNFSSLADTALRRKIVENTVSYLLSQEVGWRAATEEEGVPQAFWLGPAYPNPFNPSTEISYSLPEACWVRLEVFNVLGQRVVTLIDEAQPAGYRRIRWDGCDAGGWALASGVYFYRLRAGEHETARRMALLR